MQYDALLTVCFGTADPARFARCFAPVHAAAAACLPSGRQALAVSSPRIRTLLAGAGAVYPAPGQALAALAAAGCRQVLVLAAYLCDGEEYRALAALCAQWRRRFAALQLTLPLLSACPEGLAAAVDEAFPLRDGRGLLLVGHGAACRENGGYHALAQLLAARGRQDVALALLHGAPAPARAASALAERGFHRAGLGFLMLCAGHHARQARGPGGAFQALADAGLEAELCPVQLGESPAVQRLFLQAAGLLPAGTAGG